MFPTRRVPVFPTLLLLAPVLCAACGGDDLAEGSRITGTLDFTGEGVSGVVDTARVFSFAAGGTLISWMAANEDATCALAAAHLGAGDDDPDPTDLYVPDACNLFLFGAYDGTSASVDQDSATVSIALNCTMGEGSFAWEETNKGWAWVWSGRWWQGAPEAWTLDLEGGTGGDDPLVATLEMTDFWGSFTYEDMTEDPATGSVSGTVQAEWCPDLAQASIFAR